MESSDDLAGPNGLLNELTGALLSRVMNAEMDEHLSEERATGAAQGPANTRNGSRKKAVVTPKGKVDVQVPRDRRGTFEPKIVPKHQRRFQGFDDEIVSLYSRGMTVRDIKEHLERLYNVEVSADLISRATDAVMDELQTWKNRPLEAVYPIVVMDAIVLKVRENGRVINKAAHVALGFGVDGIKEVLGIWLGQTEGAKFWLGVLTELKNRGVEDILIACCDGLKGFPEAIETAFPKATVQTCIVHVIRASLRFVSWKERKAIAADLKPIYKAATREEAEAALDALEDAWGATHPQVIKTWRSNWERIVPFLDFPVLDFPDEVRRVIYTTNAIESLNASLRKVANPRGHFSTDDAALKMLYLAIRNRTAKWKRPPKGWSSAIQHLTIHFPDRILP
jgi:putative transposase